ncbi:MAG: riboflavin biosynthesis protein RibF [Oscillospiraceae bacterium]|jgi:riboflavin kinase/FMN adenylyltransferase|nr:riboflavin biosynthesis protein RibF [Oscillospiraceae bacterium]
MTDKNRVIALGFFDGIHIGHSALLERALAVARETDRIPSVITFDTSPKSFVTGNPVELINSPEDRAGLIHRIFGIEDVIFLHFDRTTAEIKWNEFIEMLHADFGASYLIAGRDHRFGHRGEGDADKLKAYCEERGIGCGIIPEVIYKGAACSSTLIRGLLKDGGISAANGYLGHPHVLTDVVRYGYRLGRTLGTPTINMRFGDGVLIPARGVYATRVYLDGGEVRCGVTNIGTRPTVSGGDETVTAETHIIDYRANLYGHNVRIEFFERLRPEMRFSGTDELKAQIQRDIESVRKYFAGVT